MADSRSDRTSALTLTRARTRDPGSVDGSRLVDIVLHGDRVADVRPAAAAPSEGERIDLDGRPVVPGLWDHHVHLDMWALRESRLDLARARSAAECARLVALRLTDRPVRGGGTLVGTGFRDGVWPDLPTTRDLLDSHSGATPVVLVSHDIHCAWLNSAAVHLWRPASHSDGLVRENDFYELMTRVNDLPVEQIDAAVAESVRRAHGRGVVGVVEFERRPNLDTWQRRVRAGLRLRVACGVYAEHLDDAIERGLATGTVLPETRGLVEMGSLKVLLDGSLNTRTAWCYHPFPGVEPEAAYGMRVVEPDALRDLVARAHAAGIASALHAIGDRANTLALDTFEATGASGSIEHAQLIAREDLVRFAPLGVAASVQPRHAIDDRAVADRHWSGRTDRAFLLASLLGAGARLLLGSDAPVAPLDPWVTIASAVARTGDERPPWHGEERLTLDQALSASTRHPHLSRGVPADLVVLDADPWDASADVLSAMPVASTMIAGEFISLPE